MMQTAVLIGLILVSQVMPKSNPNGTWEADTGSQFELRLVGSDVKVRIVPGSNPRFLEYELDLKGTEEPNTYQGGGRFKARLSNGRECEFDTEWQVVVVTDDRIIGVAKTVTPDPETCEIVETGQAQLDLKRIP